MDNEQSINNNQGQNPVIDYGAYGPQPAVAAGVDYQSTLQQQQNLPMQNGVSQVNNTDNLISDDQKKAKKKKAKNSTQNNLSIAEIRDGIVIMKDGSFRAVAMSRPINFDLMSPAERDSAEFAYQGFLNSLFFPIQILLHSRKIDMGPYLERLTKIREKHDNMLLALLMDNYIQYLSDMVSQVNIMDKKFFLVIPYYPHEDIQKAVTKSLDFFSGLAGLFSSEEKHVTVSEKDLENAKTMLRERMELVLNGLSQCGVKGVPLDTQELIELYYDSYNPDTATRQELRDISGLTVPVVTRGNGNAPQPNLDGGLE